MLLDDFRRIALSLPGVEELSGLGYPNFRAGRKSFATIEDSLAVIRLTRDQQATFMATAPEMFAPAPSGWGRLGSTIVRLEIADEAMLQDALATAWRNVSTPTADTVNIADVACAKVNAAEEEATEVDVEEVNVPDAAADVPRADADTTDVVSVHDAKVADIGTTVAGPDARNLADVVDAADAANAAVVDVADTAEVERDDLQSAIERLQAYCRKEPAR